MSVPFQMSFNYALGFGLLLAATVGSTTAGGGTTTYTTVRGWYETGAKELGGKKKHNKLKHNKLYKSAPLIVPNSSVTYFISRLSIGSLT